MFYAEVNLQPDRWFIRFQQLSYKIPDALFDLAHRMITSPEDLGLLRRAGGCPYQLSSPPASLARVRLREGPVRVLYDEGSGSLTRS
jgi:hypothetical protein